MAHNFIGLGSGTEQDPFQITNKAELDSIKSFSDRTFLYNGQPWETPDINLDNCVVPSNGTIKFEVTANNSLGTVTVQNQGTGYAVNDRFYIVNPNGTNALCRVTSVSSGLVLGVALQIITQYEEGITIYNYETGSDFIKDSVCETVTVTGSGSGLTIKIGTPIPNTVSAYFNNIPKGNGSNQAYLYGVSSNFANSVLPIGTSIEINLTIEGFYFKLMNDITLPGDLTTNSTLNIVNFSGVFDGNNKSIEGLSVGVLNREGIGINHNATIKNLRIKVENCGTSSLQTVFFSTGTSPARSLNNITFDNVKIITNNITLNRVLFCEFNTGTFTDLVVEADFFIFGSNFNSGVTFRRLKCLRLNSNHSSKFTLSLNSANVYNSQYHINVDLQNVNFIQSTPILFRSGYAKECFVSGNIKIIANDPNDRKPVFSIFGESCEDCYFVGEIDTNQNVAHSSSNGYYTGIFSSGLSTAIMRRCISNIKRGRFGTEPSRLLMVRTVTAPSAYKEALYFNNQDLNIVPLTNTLQKAVNNDTLKLQETFPEFDFDNVWIMGMTQPLLRNTPEYLEFENGLKFINITEVQRVSHSTFQFTINSNATNFGVRVSSSGEEIVNISNTLGPVQVSGLTQDVQLTLVPYVISSEGVEIVQTEVTYQHYFIEQVTETTIDVESENYINSLETANPRPDYTSFSTLKASNIHGSIHYNGYVYGTTRNVGDNNNSIMTTLSCIVRIPTNGNFIPEFLAIDTNLPNFSWVDHEEVVRIGKYLFFLGTPYPFMPIPPELVAPARDALIIVDTEIFDYTLITFYSPFLGSLGTEPIAGDGTHLYITTSLGTIKVDPSGLYSLPKINLNFNLTDHIVGTFNSEFFGGHVEFPMEGYTRFTRGQVHASLTDDEYLYLAYTTGSNSGYNATLGISVHEVHVIRKSDMSPVAWRYIPKCTDDMCQTNTHLFFGVEVLSNADPATYGYGWGAYALNKQELITNIFNLRMLALPQLHSTDLTPSVQSYASLIFGNKLFDFKTNKKVYIIDISNVDDWNLDSNVGEHTLKVLNFTVNGTPITKTPNEAQVDEVGNFYSFLWANPSGAMKYTIPDIDPFTVPVVELQYEVEGDLLTVIGTIILNGGKDVTSVGIKHGDPLNPDTIDIPVSGHQFSAQIPIPQGNFIVKVFAVNSEGEGSDFLLFRNELIPIRLMAMSKGKNYYSDHKNLRKLYLI